MSSRKKSSAKPGSYDYSQTSHDNAALNRSLEGMSKALDDAVKRSEEVVQSSTSPRSRSLSRGRSHSSAKEVLPGHPGTNPQRARGIEATPGTSDKDLLREQRGMPKKGSQNASGRGPSERGRPKAKGRADSGSKVSSNLLSAVLQYGETPKKIETTPESTRTVGDSKGSAMGRMVLDYGAAPKEIPPSLEILQDAQNAGSRTYQNLPPFTPPTQTKSNQRTDETPKPNPGYANIIFQYGATPKQKPNITDDSMFAKTLGTVTSELKSYNTKKSKLKREKHRGSDRQGDIKEIGRPVSNAIVRQSSSLDNRDSAAFHEYQDIGDYLLPVASLERPEEHAGIPESSRRGKGTPRHGDEVSEGNLSARYGEAYDCMEDVEFRFGDVVYAPINYVLWILSVGIIGFFAVALVVIYVMHRRRSKAKKRHQLLQRRRKGMQYCRPTSMPTPTVHVDAPTETTSA